ncbi:MAG: hypothetical protein JSU01_17400 [Bacteroidetes bacterium]|nr:hypothetical protein [Bacteroidota bacterium]
MLKPVTLAAFTVLMLFSKLSSAQDELKISQEKASKKDTKIVEIKSLGGKDVKVRVIPDYVNHVLKVICLKDSITVNNWGIAPDIAILNNQFIKLEYPMRAGSNEGRTDMLIVCVSNGKLHEAIHIVESTNYEFGDSHELYEIKTVLNGNNKKNYQLNVSIHDDSYSKDKPEENFVYDSHSVLHFDTITNAFYSIKTGFWDTHTFHTNKGRSFKKHMRGYFPVIFLGDYTYYLIDGRWYEKEFATGFDEI